MYKNERFYKTGDLAKLNNDLDIESIGRTDFPSENKREQERVELEEIVNVTGVAQISKESCC